MQVLQLLTDAKIHNTSAGIAKVMVELADGLIERNHDVISVYNDHLEGEIAFRSQNIEKIRNLEINFNTYGNTVSKIYREIINITKPSKLWFSLPNPVVQNKAKKIASKLVPIILESKPDIVICYGIIEQWALKYALCECEKITNKSYVKTPSVHMVHTDIVTYKKKIKQKDIYLLQECAAVQVLIPSFAQELAEIIQCNIKVIPNIVHYSPLTACLTENKDRKRIIFHSRISSAKQQDLLLESFAMIANKYPDWDLYIFGSVDSEEYYQLLNRIIDDNKLHERVKICNPTTEVIQELAKSDIFAFPSTSEGWGLALTEAMSVGLPCIGLTSTPATNYLINNANSGILTDNNKYKFSEVLECLISRKDLRIRFGENARLAMADYHRDIVISKWEELLEKVQDMN